MDSKTQLVIETLHYLALYILFQTTFAKPRNSTKLANSPFNVYKFRKAHNIRFNATLHKSFLYSNLAVDVLCNKLNEIFDECSCIIQFKEQLICSLVHSLHY